MFLFCLVFAMSLCASVYMCFVVTCWERADLLALVFSVYCEFVTFPGILGQVWYLIVSIPDLCTLTYFHYSCEGRIEKSVPQYHHLSSLGKSRDAKRRSSGWIFLSYPHTHDIFYIKPYKVVFIITVTSICTLI